MDDKFALLPLSQLAPLIRKKDLSPVELLEAILTRIERFDSQLNSYITVLADSARAEARQAEKEILNGHYRGPLHGIPVSIKDLFATRGARTTCGSKVLADWVPDYDATAVARWREAGAVIVGKTNMHEFAYGVTNNNPHYGPVRNPWDLERVPGGSSGGSGAAVAASLCTASLGSDTGGSIRIPSAVCGVVGIKPTYGRVSRYGAIPLAWSIDHVGPLAKSVEDAALLLAALAGPDPKDTTGSDRPVPDYTQGLSGEVGGVRLGIPEQYFFEHVDPEILTAVQQAIRSLEQLGASAQPVSLPHLENCAAMEAHITLAEATSYHEPHMRTRIDDYGDGVRIDLEAGRYLLATDYVKSQRARALLLEVFGRAFEQVDVIVSPTLPAFPPLIGELYVQSGDLREHVIDAFLRFSIPYNLTGLPAISVPCGFSSSGLPIGLQIAGRAFDEPTVLRVAHAYEAHTEWHLRKPSLGN
ncbi:MAG TPA: amidase [Candidatus Acidoferrales bacterium]|nr:amidase [Candidatus Acidoferrales bacterium]